MKKDSAYFLIFITWLLLVLATLYEHARPLVDAGRINGTLFYITFFTILLSFYFWLNVIKDIFFIALFSSTVAKVRKITSTIKGNPLVELLYYTDNAFDYKNFQKSVYQEYGKYRIVILYTSTDSRIKRQIAYQARKFGANVFQCDSNSSKTTSINTYLKKSKASFFVLLDDTGYIPEDFISKALPYFRNKKVAVVQANHIDPVNKKEMIDQFAEGLSNHSTLYQLMRGSYGFLPVSNHGVIIRKEAYNKTSGFFYLHAEDLTFSLALRKKGYIVRFVKELQYLEKHNYFNQSCRYTMINVLFMLYNARKVFHAKMRWFEKLDIFLFMHQLPLRKTFVLYYMIILVMQFIMTAHLRYTVEMQVRLLLLLFLPVLQYGGFLLVTQRLEFVKVYNTVRYYEEVGKNNLTNAVSNFAADIQYWFRGNRIYQKLLLAK